jgi:hypothetical protein
MVQVDDSFEPLAALFGVGEELQVSAAFRLWKPRDAFRRLHVSG